METDVLIIGGGITGAGIARDLALRGVKCLLVEKKDVDAGASGGNHGLLHSGARYVASDIMAAKECRNESRILKKIAPHCIEDSGGLFVAVKGDDEKYIRDFPEMCRAAGLVFEEIDIKDAKDMEPALSDEIIAAFKVEDGCVDPFKLTLDNLSQALKLGASFMGHSEVVSFETDKGKIVGAYIFNSLSGKKIRIEANLVINATGAWADKVAHFAGIKIPLVCSKGTLLVTQARITKRVVNRLRKATDGDILVPGGTVSILGTTSVRIDDPDKSRPTRKEVDQIIEQGAAMIPELGTTRYIRAYSGVRPLFSSGDTENDRSVSRGFALLDHAKEGVKNFITITGGKLTTYRLMAEKTSDLACKKLGVNKTCKTAKIPIPLSDNGRWTEPGLSPKLWIKKNDPDDIILCECEMVSKAIIDSISQSIENQGGKPNLTSVSLRSRVGKGPCQGGFCGARITAHLYDRGILKSGQGMDELKNFVRERWHGNYPILWDLALEQAELQEALYCGLFGLELPSSAIL